MKLNSLRELIKEELKRALNENMFEVGDIVKYMGEDHKVISDDGYVIELESVKSSKKVSLNYRQAKEKIRRTTDFMNEAQLEEIKGSQIDVGDVFTLNGDIGLFKSGETVQVKDKKMYGNDIKIILSNDQGVTDDFLIDIDDDFEQLG
jgi:hypothetical protein